MSGEYFAEFKIAKHIPTKRELKHYVIEDIVVCYVNCKAHPDEKGIETRSGWGCDHSRRHCKAHPDEKGIETLDAGVGSGKSLILQSTSRRKGN